MKMNRTDMLQDIDRILISEEELHKRIKEVAAQISIDYADKDPIVVGILNGVVPFYAAMTQAITVPMIVDFMSVKSYAGTSSTGILNIRKDLDHDIEGRHVLILEDILDSGVTLTKIKELFSERKPASVKICTMLDKPEGRTNALEADYVCFTVPNAFVVGMGLDYDDYYRNLPFVGVLKPEVYQD